MCVLGVECVGGAVFWVSGFDIPLLVCVVGGPFCGVWLWLWVGCWVFWLLLCLVFGLVWWCLLDVFVDFCLVLFVVVLGWFGLVLIVWRFGFVFPWLFSGCGLVGSFLGLIDLAFSALLVCV